jgi:hypothetical protein
MVLKDADGSREVLPFQAKRFSVATASGACRVVALDDNGAALGPARSELRDSFLQIQPVPGAVSYRAFSPERQR